MKQLNVTPKDYVEALFDDSDYGDGVGYEGPKVITFSGILNYNMIPLVKIIKELLRVGGTGMGSPVEIEFASTTNEKGKPEFYILQIRPLAGLKEKKQIKIKQADIDASFIHTNKALGNGALEGIRDILFIPPDKFDNTRTLDIAQEIGQMNKELEGSPYLLVGPGRWGTRDHSLGIPVEWEHISNARAMVEASLEDFRIDPSHGTHFFHNITSLGIMYFSIPYGTGKAPIDWDWLTSQIPEGKKEHVIHIRLDKELCIKVDGRSGQGVVGEGGG